MSKRPADLEPDEDEFLRSTPVETILSDPELADLRLEEAERIRNRVFAAVGAGKRWWRRSLAIAATVTVALLAGLLWYPRTAPQIATPRPTVFQVKKAPVKLPASVLVWRGAGDEYAAELGRAIALYRAGQYSEAAQQLEAVTRSYPQSAEAHFYLGVSQLLLGRPSDARESLKRAGEIDRGSLADDISWYLALAHVKRGNPIDAETELRKLCAKPGPYAARACAGLQEIEADRR